MPTGDYQSDLLRLLIWLVVILGSAVVSLSAWFATKIMARLDESNRRLDETNRLIKDETAQLRELFHGIDKRVIRLETKAGIHPLGDA